MRREGGPPPPARPRGSPSERGPRRGRVERSAGGVVVRIADGEPRILLIRDPYGRWGLPKGHLEDGESAAEAALREVREETGLGHLLLGPDLGEIDWTFRRRGRTIHKFCRFFLMTSPKGDTRPERAEGISECRWLPPDRALETLSYGNARGILRAGVERLGELPGEGVPFRREE